MTITSGATPSPTATGGPIPSPSGQSSGEAAGAAQYGAAATGTTPGRVFMGYVPGPHANSPFTSEAGQARQQTQPRKPNWLSEADAANQYFNWTQKARDDFRAKGLLSGQLPQGAGDLEAYSLWVGLVKQAALYGAQNQQVGPLDILSGYVKGNSSGGWIKDSTGRFETNPLTGEKRYIGPKSATTTQSQVDLTDPATARAIAVTQFQSLLGRDPGQGEINAFAQALTQSEAQNPSTAATTTQYDPTTGTAVATNTVTGGGMTPQGQAQLAADQVKNSKEYGATQAATTYMNALESTVKAGG